VRRCLGQSLRSWPGLLAVSDQHCVETEERVEGVGQGAAGRHVGGVIQRPQCQPEILLWRDVNLITSFGSRQQLQVPLSVLQPACAGDVHLAVPQLHQTC
jgi:hypothetical protein